MLERGLRNRDRWRSPGVGDGRSLKAQSTHRRGSSGNLDRTRTEPAGPRSFRPRRRSRPHSRSRSHSQVSSSRSESPRCRDRCRRGPQGIDRRSRKRTPRRRDRSGSRALRRCCSRTRGRHSLRRSPTEPNTVPRREGTPGRALRFGRSESKVCPRRHRFPRCLLSPGHPSGPRLRFSEPGSSHCNLPRTRGGQSIRQASGESCGRTLLSI